jgi:hypothetical protein
MRHAGSDRRPEGPAARRRASACALRRLVRGDVPRRRRRSRRRHGGRARRLPAGRGRSRARLPPPRRRGDAPPDPGGQGGGPALPRPGRHRRAAQDRGDHRQGSGAAGQRAFALPQYAADGARAIWGTADAIWEALGDASDDYNWYTKRATLSAVYGATVLYWLGDESPENRDTWAFLDRRIEDVMRIEKVKAEVQKNPVLSKARRRAGVGPVADQAAVADAARRSSGVPDAAPGA